MVSTAQFNDLAKRVNDLERDNAHLGQIAALRDEFAGMKSDFFLDIAAGKIAGHSHVNKFGENSAVASGGTEDVWDIGGTYVFPATADITHILTDVDDATMQGETIEVQGLDTNWALVTQTADLDGANTTTAVALSTALRRVFRMKVLADVVAAQDINATNVGDTQDYARIQIGENQTQMAIYTIPLNTTGYLTQYYRDYVKVTGAAPNSVEFSMYHADRENGYEFQLKHSGAIQDGASGIPYEFKPYLKATEKTDIVMRATANGAAAHVHSGFDIILVEDGF